MGFYYNVPRIAEYKKGLPDGSVQYAQKGPTCWYYSAKMMLKFHGMTDPTQEKYEQFKSVHEMRKALTELSETKGIINPKKHDNFFKELKEVLEGRVGEAEVKDLLDRFVDNTGNWGKVITRVRILLNQLGAFEKESLSQIEIANRLMSDVFIDIKMMSPLKSKNSLRKALLEHGPFYAGGELSVSDVETREEKDEWSQHFIRNVVALKDDSSHAVVVTGIKSDTAIFVDPNFSNERRSIPIEQLRSKAKKFYTVRCPQTETGYACTHCKSVIDI